MSVRNFVPTVWSAKLFQELDKAHILVNLCNRDYEGEITSYGDQVKINMVGDITVNTYSPNATTITPQQLNSAQALLNIDQAKYFAFYLDDVDAAQVKPKLMAEAMRKSAYALGDTADQFVAALYSDAGLTLTWSTAGPVTQTNAMSVLSQAAQALDESNVPSQGRWMVIPPWYHQLLVLNKILETEGSVGADDAYNNGFLGRAFGFNLYMSNNLSTGNKLLGGLNESHRALAGTSRSISFAEQVVKMEAYRPEDSFSDAVKGLHVYGGKVVDSAALIDLAICSSSTST